MLAKKRRMGIHFTAWLQVRKRVRREFESDKSTLQVSHAWNVVLRRGAITKFVSLQIEALRKNRTFALGV